MKTWLALALCSIASGCVHSYRVDRVSWNFAKSASPEERGRIAVRAVDARGSHYLRATVVAEAPAAFDEDDVRIAPRRTGLLGRGMLATGILTLLSLAVSVAVVECSTSSTDFLPNCRSLGDVGAGVILGGSVVLTAIIVGLIYNKREQDFAIEPGRPGWTYLDPNGPRHVPRPGEVEVAPPAR